MTEPRFDDPDVQRVEAALWASGGTLVMGPNEAARIAVEVLRDGHVGCTASTDAPCFHDSHRQPGNGPEAQS